MWKHSLDLTVPNSLIARLNIGTRPEQGNNVAIVSSKELIMQGNNTKLILPPYGSILENYHKHGIILEVPVYIFCGKRSWQEAKKYLATGSPALCLPYQSSAEQYTWPIANCRCVLFDTGGMAELDLKKIAAVLLESGAQTVCIYSEAYPTLIY